MEEKINSKISILETSAQYPNFPFDDDNFQEEILRLLKNLGLQKDNPFSAYVKRGGKVLIKPNWVRDHNPLGDFDSLITHSSLIKVILDLVAKALEGEGQIIIGDAPLQNCKFERLLDLNKIKEVVQNFKIKFPNISVLIEDWRITQLDSSVSNRQKIQSQKISLEEAQNMGYTLIDLKDKSFLEEISDKSDRFRVTKYKPSLLKQHHRSGKHEYLVTSRVLDADFIINMPKLKTHIKAGLTGALKNLVGINGHKEFLPHHIKGSAEEGGDNYPYKNFFRSKYENLYDYVWENLNNFSVWKRKILLRILRTLEVLSFVLGEDTVTAGSWPGNDTIWRTTLDLNHILYFGGKPKKVLTIVDGLIAGEGKGPLEPTPKKAGLLIAGENPALVDATIAKIIGYKIENIKTVQNALSHASSRFAVKDYENISLQYSAADKTENVPLFEVESKQFKKAPYWEKQ